MVPVAIQQGKGIAKRRLRADAGIVGWEVDARRGHDGQGSEGLQVGADRSRHRGQVAHGQVQVGLAGGRGEEGGRPAGTVRHAQLHLDQMRRRSLRGIRLCVP